MKNNYNPYTVPENFFENTSKHAVAKFHNRRRAIHYSIAAMVVVAALVITPLFIHIHDRQIQGAEAFSTNLAGLYEYDLFLQVNFIE